MSNNRLISAAGFDVLVIYSDVAALSASGNSGMDKPFNSSYEKFNDVYAYFLSKCEEIGLSAALSTTGDIIGSGKCRSYWLFKNRKWVKVDRPCYSRLIFDKFFPSSTLRRIQRKRMFLSPDVKSFTSKSLMDIFFDKFQTYSKLRRYSVPTVKVDGSSKKSIEDALVKLRRKTLVHAKNEDFGRSVILKDRYGAGGNNIYSISTNFTEKIFDLLKDNRKLSFILQPHISFEAGYQYRDNKGATEIRLIYKGKKIVQTYIRIAKGDDFICNNGGGGIWISEEDIPLNVKKASDKIANSLDKKNAIFALDFIVSDKGNVYLLEANVSPGIDWYEEFPQNKKMNQAMIDIISVELFRRAMINRTNRQDISRLNSDQKKINISAIGNNFSDKIIAI